MFSRAHGEPLIFPSPSLSLPGTPGKDKIYLSSPEVDNIGLQRGHADTGQNIRRCAADTDPLSLSLSLFVRVQSNKQKHTQTQTHTKALTWANL